MGKIILKTPSITINGVELSDHISKVTINETFNQVDVSAFGAIFKQIAQGLGDASISCDFYQDFDPASVDATLYPLVLSGSIFPIVVKPTGTTVSSTNPSYTMQGIVADYNPVDGAVGAASTMTVTFPNAAQTGVVKATA